MLLKSFSKINLSLRVNKKLKNRELHDIQSYFCMVNLFDQLVIKKNKGPKDIIKFHGKFARHVNNAENSVVDTLRILRKKNVISNFYTVLVNKKIPVFSGMGGGTSNAHCLIKHFIKKKIDKNFSSTLERKIGSDLKIFFYKQGFLKNNRTIKNFKKKHRLFFLLVYPNICCSTKLIYSKIKNYSPKSKYIFSKINDKNQFITLLTDENNDLQSIVERKHPIIKGMIKEIRQKKGCYFSRMTGSGSVCYGLFKSERLAKTALNTIKAKYPKFWLSVAKTI